MSGSANVSSIDAICEFAAAVLRFQEEARLCLTALDSQLRQIQSWLEQDRPVFWKHEIESCTRRVADARIRLHQCRMRRVGDFRPTCFEEQKDLEQAKRSLDFAMHQIPAVKRWCIAAQHEANEFHGRASQIVQLLERDIPRLLALLGRSVDRLDAYAAVSTPGNADAVARLTELINQIRNQRSGDAVDQPDSEPPTHPSQGHEDCSL